MDTKISLYEYGLIRNPDTNKVIFCLNPNWMEGEKPIIKTDYIEFDEVQLALENIDIGYFDYIGCSKEKALARLDNRYLTLDILPINQYNGYFIDHLYYS